ncbi:holin [Streptococcus phage CHPC873]|uniref:Holin n=1 Tax=Streptococcus phage CHPC873 TaxID=2365042 RepID=A0A3G8F767_9CAUD|nr:holin [Streptococcus phage CHPC873]AZF90626.1 holin [Streptococcus phage CHPC873]
MGIFNNINVILGVAVACLTLFGFFQNKMTNNERRLTILEEKNNQQDRELAEVKNILDNHDQQMKVLIQMTEQIKNLSEKIEKIDKKLEEVK